MNKRYVYRGRCNFLTKEPPTPRMQIFQLFSDRRTPRLRRETSCGASLRPYDAAAPSPSPFIAGAFEHEKFPFFPSRIYPRPPPFFCQFALGSCVEFIRQKTTTPRINTNYDAFLSRDGEEGPGIIQDTRLTFLPDHVIN